MVEHVDVPFLLQFFDILVVSFEDEIKHISLSEGGYLDGMRGEDTANHLMQVAGLVFRQNIEQVLGGTLSAAPGEAHALEAIQHSLGGDDSPIISPAFLLGIPKTVGVVNA